MPEIFTSNPTSTFSRKANLADFLDDKPVCNTKNNSQHSQNDVNIAKNQQEFGHRKRIKP